MGDGTCRFSVIYHKANGSPMAIRLLQFVAVAKDDKQLHRSYLYLNPDSL
jgi:hypothetical protein